MTSNKKIFHYANSFTEDKFSLVESPKFRKSYFSCSKILFETNSFDLFINLHKEIKIKKIKYKLPEINIFKKFKKIQNESILRRERFFNI